MEENAVMEAQDAKELLGRLYVLIRNARNYDRHNQAMLTSARAAHELVGRLLEEDESARFDIVDDCVFYNNVKLRTDITTFGIIRHLVHETKRRGVRALILDDTAEVEDLVGFAVAFASFRPSCPEPFKEMTRLLQVEGVAGVHILREEGESADPDEDESSTAGREVARRAFFSAFHIVRETVRGGISRGTVNPRKIKRVMETVVDSILRDEESMLALTQIRDYDAYTYYHSLNVCLLSIAVGNRLGLPKSVLREIGIAALFHDIGKTHIPRSILNKPADLTPEEWRQMRMHTKQGVLVLTSLKRLDRAIVRGMVVAFCHHMNINRSGYPATRRYVKPDVFSRIVRIADVFDALTSARCYKMKPFSREEALEIIIEKSGTELDPVLAEMIRDVVSSIPEYRRELEVATSETESAATVSQR